MAEVQANYGGFFGTTGGFIWLPILLLFILVLVIFPFFGRGFGVGY